MEALDNILENPLLRQTHEQQRAALLVKFPELKHSPHQYFLALHKYIERTPYRFYSESTYASFLAWLKDRDTISQPSLQKYLSAHDAQLNSAFLHLEEINSLDWHDHFEQLDDYELIRFIDQRIHPTYLRLTEAIFAPLCRVIAYFSRVDRGKGTDGLDLWPIVDELGKTSLWHLPSVYRHTVRNAVAHGGISYLQQEIRYRDKKGNEEKHTDSDIIRMFDDLLDACNALALALSLFLLSQPPGRYHLPQQLLLSELREETKTPWWEISGCTPSEFAGLNQLIVYARPKTSDFNKVQLSTFQSGVLAEKFAPGYKRYFFSIRSASSLPGWAGLNGEKLNELRMANHITIDDYAAVFEEGGVFWRSRIRLPRAVYRFHNLLLSIKLHWPLVMADLRRQRNQPDIHVRNASIHRNAWGCVLDGCVYIDTSGSSLTQDVVRKFKRQVIRKTLQEARQRVSRSSGLRLLPLGFARVGVFCKDYRRRRLSGFGLGPHLVCTIQIQRIRRIRRPDIMGSAIEQLGRYRIAWNRAWLEDNT